MDQSFLNSIEEIKVAREYWFHKLGIDIDEVRLPVEYKAYNKYDKKVFDVCFDECISNKLLLISNNQNITIFVVLLAGLKIMLYKYLNQENLVVGAPTYEYPEEQVEYNKVLPFISEINDEKTFKELLISLRDTVSKGYGYQYYPVEKVLDQLNISPEISLYRILCLLEDIHEKELISDVINSGLNDITFVFKRSENVLKGEIIYNGALFSEKAIEGFWQSYINIFNSVLSDINTQIGSIDILSDKDKEAIRKFNSTDKENGMPYTVVEMFEEAVKANPDGDAIVFGSNKLSYEDLNSSSNKVAIMLRNMGIVPNDVVAVIMERSIEMLIGIIGILKSGAAYLPIDPNYPVDRIKYMLEDGGAKALLSNQKMANNVGYEHNYINIKNEMLYNSYPPNPDKINTAADLAYIIYTSGTTGKPKGVMVSHESISNSIKWRAEEYKLSVKDRVLQLFSYSFDGFITSFFTPIISGSTVVILNDENALDPVAIADIINEEKISHFICVPSLFKAILDNVSQEQLKSLSKVTLAGESTTSDLISYSRQKKADLEIINEYGPTESSVVTTIKRGLEKENRITIGKPIANTRVYITNKRGQQMPIDVPGELCIAGKGLAIGYRNNDSLTKERFVSNEYLNEKRVYRTGDLARWLYDGNIEFLGRADNQVKIRGFRIEIEEVEKHIIEHNDISQAAVLPLEDNERNLYLCAFIVSKRELTTIEIIEFLAGKLPNYMIPTKFVSIDKMPIMSGGKINRKALISTGKSIKSGTDYVPPTNQIEQKLVDIWCDVLELERVGINDNFFVIGGNSLKATVLANRIYKEFSTEISLMEIFRALTVKSLAQRVISADKSLYLSLEPVGERDYYPVSSAQKRMFILNELNRFSTIYNMPGALEVDGNLDISKFVKAFEGLIYRHEALRTSFEFIDGEPVQRIHRNVDFKVDFYDGSERKFEEILVEFIKPFDLKKAPLLRVGLAKVSEERYIIIFDMHHIISDGVSTAILLNEFVSLYQGKVLPDITLQYKDFAVWQNKMLKSDFIIKQMEYWLKLYGNGSPSLNIPTDYQRPLIQSFEGANYSFSLDRELKEALNGIAVKTQTTMNMILLAAYYVLLYRYTGQKDIVVGTPVAGRYHSDLENIMGMFVNTLAIRNFPEGNISFGQFLDKVKKNSLEAYENQLYQFEELVEKLNIERSLGRNPLFDTMFVMQNIELPKMQIEGLRFIVPQMDNTSSKFDITLSASEGEDIELNFNYSTKLFKRDTIKRMARHFVNIIRSITDNITLRISDISIIDDEDKDIIIDVFNDTHREYDHSMTVVECFERKVSEIPHRVALLYGEKSMTYKELNLKINQFARLLRDKGVTRGSIVAIMMERCFEMVIGIYAILKAGGAYLPIDIECPRERLKFILEDSNAKLLMIRDNSAGKYTSDCEQINIDSDIWKTENGSKLENINSQDDLAYVIYTSGSTGMPKGVLVQHKGMYNILDVLQEKYPLNEEDAYLLKTTYTFDVSVTELFGWFFGGGKLVILANGEEKNPYAIIESIHQNSITHINFVPSMLNAFLSLLKQEDAKLMNSLKYIFCAGESLSSDLAERFLRSVPWVRLENIYGPTEGTIYATAYSVTDSTGTSGIPIGKPLGNTKSYIFDEDGNLQPVGVPGELCIAGDGVAIGYLKRPELTNEKFVSDPFVIGSRMYKTGDLARWRQDGNIEFLGRLDSQIKIRGYRIELGEIESCLMKLNAITSAVVVENKDSDGNFYLCAYYVSNEEIEHSELKEHLLLFLPKYMIPTRFLRLDEIPLTSNGKVDRCKLPKPEYGINREVDYIEPRNEKEKLLAHGWEQVLKIDSVGVFDDFFELGGNSLKAIELLMILSKDFEINMNDIFQYSTINDLAGKVSLKKDNLLIKARRVLEKVNSSESLNDYEIKNDRFYKDTELYNGKNMLYQTMDLGDRTCYNNILLTGASGYLGIHLLLDLLRNTQSNIYLIVRAFDTFEAEKRIKSKLEFYFDNQIYEENKNRIKIICGDISEKFLGLTEKQYIDLSFKIDGILNSAANVKHYGHYEESRSVNVEGIKNLIEFAKTSKTKDVHHISTISLTDETKGDGEQVLFTEFDRSWGYEYSLVYLKTKAEAERLLENARDAGVNVNIYRVGNLVFQSESGVFQENIHSNAFYTLFSSLVRLGVFPQVESQTLDFTFVDHASRAIVLMLGVDKLKKETFHIFNPNRMSLAELGTHLIEAGIKLQIKPLKLFLEKVCNEIENNNLGSDIGNLILHSNILDSDGGPRMVVSADKTNILLEKLGFRWEEVKHEHIERMVEYCGKIGFI